MPKGRPDTTRPAIEAWYLENDSEKFREFIQGETIKSIYDDEFSVWLDNNNLSITYASFQNKFKMFLKEKGLETSTTRKHKKHDNKENSKRVHWSVKFEMIREYTEMIAKGYISSLFIYGTSGIGKDYEVEKTLQKYDNVEYVGGSLKKTSDLVKFLYENRKDKVIVISDSEGFYSKSKEIIGILKIALDDKDIRHISYIDNSTSRPKKDRIPNTFAFTSGIIFISNTYRVDSALVSRFMEVHIDMSKDDKLEKIENTLNDFMPRIPIDIKKKVLVYIKGIKEEISVIDYRKFKFAVATYLSLQNKEDNKPNKWKEWVKILLNNGR